MAKNPLFSTYKQGENRVTSSMLAVFERVDLSLLEGLLASAAGESSLQMVSFANQPLGSGHSVPDARISARFAYWFEVKTMRNALGATQLEEHLANLHDDTNDERLFVITPDLGQPEAVGNLADHRVVWFNFRALYDAIESTVADVAGDVSEQARFLLRELGALLVEEGLVDNDDVVVVAARYGYPEYLDCSAYVCQPERAFRPGLTHMAFYADSAIQREVPSILYRESSVPFTYDEATQRLAAPSPHPQLGKLIAEMLESGTREEGKLYQVFLLSPPDDAATVRLANTITNDTVAASGRRWAWTMGQRYVSLEDLSRPGVRVTSELAAD
jgi:hypothetical protein